LTAVGLFGLTFILLGLTLAGFGKLNALRIDQKAVLIGGCGKPFLDSLPPLESATQASAGRAVGQTSEVTSRTFPGRR